MFVFVLLGFCFVCFCWVFCYFFCWFFDLGIFFLLGFFFSGFVLLGFWFWGFCFMCFVGFLILEFCCVSFFYFFIYFLLGFCFLGFFIFFMSYISQLSVSVYCSYYLIICLSLIFLCWIIHSVITVGKVTEHHGHRWFCDGTLCVCTSGQLGSVWTYFIIHSDSDMMLLFGTC